LKHTISDAIPPNSTIFIPQPAIHAVSSAGAQLVSCAILTPAEVLKQNAQVVARDGSGKRRSPTLEVFQQFRRQPSKLFRGYTTLAARNLPFTGLQFPAFERLKSYFLAERQRRQGGKPVDGILERVSITAVSGSIAGSCAAWITTPIDVVKTRVMLAAGEVTAQAVSKAQAKNLRSAMKEAARKSGWLVAREIFRNEGVRGMFRGGLLRSVWAAMGSGLYLGCYEGGRFYLEDQRKIANANEGDNLMQKDWKNIKVGIGNSRSQDIIKKSAWQDE
jgi:solute carrier family 25 (mitochondrial S-adenosylmethionine transporter), member 26